MSAERERGKGLCEVHVRLIINYHQMNEFILTRLHEKIPIEFRTRQER
jgi:hypothetical protein